MTWAIVAAALRLVFTVLVIVKITKFYDTLNPVERFGLGLMGGCSLLTVHVLWEGGGSPYDGWAVTFLTFGALLFVGGRTWRDWKHKIANDQQVAYWEARQRGQ